MGIDAVEKDILDIISISQVIGEGVTLNPCRCIKGKVTLLNNETCFREGCIVRRRVTRALFVGRVHHESVCCCVLSDACQNKVSSTPCVSP